MSRLSVAILCIAACSAGGEVPGGAERSESGRYLARAVGTDAGLPQTNVTAVLESRDGYLWVGTEGGLGRFDGVRFTTYRVADTPAFVSHSIASLFEDRDGVLWIGAERGLTWLEHGQFHASGLADAAIDAIAQDRAGEIWAGTTRRGLFRLAKGRPPAAVAFSGPVRPIRAVFFDSSNRLWLGLEQRTGGVWYRDQAGFHTFTGNGRMTGTTFAICEQPAGTLWFGGQRGLYRLVLPAPAAPPESGRLSTFGAAQGLASTQVTDVRPSREGGLWAVASLLHEISLGVSPRIVPIARMPTENARTAWEDREGGIWLAAQGDGLIRVRRTPFKTVGVEDGLPGPTIKAVSIAPSGDLWLAIQRYGVAVLARDGTVTLAPFPPGTGGPLHDPLTVFADRRGTVWAGFSTALSCLRDGRATANFGITGVTAIFEDRAGTLWFGSDSEAWRRGPSGQIVALDLGGPSAIKAFAQDEAGRIFAGTSDGLRQWRERDSRFVSVPGSSTVRDVRALLADHKGRLWVGTKGRGLGVWADGRWYNPDVLSEAFTDHVSAIGEDGFGRLWLGTPSGVAWADEEELWAAARGDIRAPRVRLAGLTDDFKAMPASSGSQPAAARGAGGIIWFGTRRGLLAIDSNHLPAEAVAPLARIERVLVDGRPEDASDGIAIPPGARQVAIEYTAPAFDRPNLMRFLYKMDGYDRSWVDAGARRIASYTSLRPGRYRFEVRARNSDGVWNEASAALAIVQRPYFWQTGWFFGLAAAAAAAGAAAIHRWRTAALRRDNEKLNRLVGNRTHELELSNTAKSEFLDHVAHEIRNPLNGLRGLLDLLKRERLDPRPRQLAESVEACTGGLIRVFEQVLGHSQLEYSSAPPREEPFSPRELLLEISRSFSWQAEQAGCALSVEGRRGAPEFFTGDVEKIRTIVGNLAANAIKYAPGRPVVLRAEAHQVLPDRCGASEASAGGWTVEFEVSDSGPGIPAGEQELIFKKFVRGEGARKAGVAGAGLGLATCRVLASALGGSVGVDSEPGTGATFFLRVRLSATERPAPGVADRPESVLIVEDEPYNQTVLKGILLDLGHAATVVAANADQAGAECSRREFGIVFVDWELPGLKGGDVARAIRARPGGDKPIIVAMTAHERAEIGTRCAEAGMDALILKPFDRAGIREILARARERRAAVDLTALADYARGAEGGASEAVGAYLQTLEKETGAIMKAHAANDFAGLAAATHRARALGGLIGAGRFVAAVRRIEMAARSGSRQDLPAAVSAFAGESTTLAGEVAAAVQRRKDSTLHSPGGSG